MAVVWQTLEEAALALGISSRTLHRRIAKGEFQTRLENGRREVQVAVRGPSAQVAAANMSDVRDPLPSERQTVADTLGQASGTAVGSAGGVNDASDGVSQSSNARNWSEDGQTHALLALHEDRLRRTDLAVLAYQQSVTSATHEAQRAHRRLRVAWSLAGTSVVILFLAGLWATHSLTKARGDSAAANDKLRQVSDTAAASAKDAETSRQEAEAARVAAAKAQGQLEAAQKHIDMMASRVKELTQARQALEARALADAAQQATARVSDQPTAKPAPAAATRPASAVTQPFLYWSDTITRPINP
jgi:hypothetical protein